MALPSAALSRFDFGGHRRVAGIFHGNSGRVVIGRTRQVKLHQNVFRSSTLCLLHDTMPGSSNSALSTVSTIPHDSSTIIPHSLHEVLADCLHGLIVADIDPATAKLAITITGPFLSAFGFLFILRIVMSWYPKLPVKKFPYVVAYAPTEPFLSITRKVIPPLGGVDVTPVVWFGLGARAAAVRAGAGQAVDMDPTVVPKGAAASGALAGAASSAAPLLCKVAEVDAAGDSGRPGVEEQVLSRL